MYLNCRGRVPPLPAKTKEEEENKNENTKRNHANSINNNKNSMLILVGVSVSVALNSGLFKTAQGAAKNTEAERINETKLSTGIVNIGGEDVDITNTANINAYLDKQKLKEQGYTHKLVAESGENTFECYVKEDTRFEQLDTLYDEVSVASESDSSIMIFGLYMIWFVMDEDGGSSGYAEPGDEVLEWFSYLDSIEAMYGEHIRP